MLTRTGSSLRGPTVGLLVQRAVVWLQLLLPVLSTRGPQRGENIQHWYYSVAPPHYSPMQFLILLCVSVSQCSRASGQEPRELWERSSPITIYWPVTIKQPQNCRGQRGLPARPWQREEQQTGAEDTLRLLLSTAKGQSGEREQGRQRDQRVWAAEWQQWVSISLSICCFTSNLDSCFRQNMFIFTQWKVVISCLHAAHTVSEVEQNDPYTVSLSSHHNSCSSWAPPSPPLPNYDTTR